MVLIVGIVGLLGYVPKRMRKPLPQLPLTTPPPPPPPPSRLFWMVLILGTMALLGSCAKKDEKTTAAAAIPAEGTGTTASGTITGSTITGTYNTSHLGEEPSGGCVDNSTSISNHGYPSETKSHTKKFIITGTSTYTVSQVGYSDAACSTMTSYWNTMYTDFTVGSTLSSLTAGTPAKPTTGAKISRVTQ